MFKHGSNHNLSSKFKFGLESEYLVIRKNDFEPLWHKDLNFHNLNAIFEDIPLHDLPSCEGLELEAPQTKLMPFVVEGYHLPDMDFQAKELLPKGVEIRTPVCNSLPEVLTVHRELHQRLRHSFQMHNYDLVSLSHHPTESKFSGPQNKRRHDYWQWSMEVMTTYGPDINVGLPEEITECLQKTDFMGKVNYYAPALSALSVASPFYNDKAWEYAPNKFGKSYRMHKRSYIAPPIEIHPDENNRFEFKVFDMPSSLREIEAQFLSFLLIILNEDLQKTCSHQDRIYELGEVAKKGLAAEQVQDKLHELFQNSDTILQNWGFNTEALSVFKTRLQTGITPADEMLRKYQSGVSIKDILKERCELTDSCLI